MTSREMHFQMVRPGIALYGGRAVQGRRNPMAPVVTLEAPVLQVKDITQIQATGLNPQQIEELRQFVARMGNGDAGSSAALCDRRLDLPSRFTLDIAPRFVADLERGFVSATA